MLDMSSIFKSSDFNELDRSSPRLCLSSLLLLKSLHGLDFALKQIFLLLRSLCLLVINPGFSVEVDKMDLFEALILCFILLSDLQIESLTPVLSVFRDDVLTRCCECVHSTVDPTDALGVVPRLVSDRFEGNFLYKGVIFHHPREFLASANTAAKWERRLGEVCACWWVWHTEWAIHSAAVLSYLLEMLIIDDIVASLAEVSSAEAVV